MSNTGTIPAAAYHDDDYECDDLNTLLLPAMLPLRDSALIYVYPKSQART